MSVRALLGSVCTLALLLGALAPVAAAQTDGFTSLEPPSAAARDALVSGDARTDADIINGEPVADGAYPYVGLVLLFDAETGEITSTCTGSLIGDRYVLTAAHCLIDVTAAAVALDFEDLADLETAEVIVADAAAVPPDFDFDPPRNDIALLRLEAATAVQPVAVADVADDDLTTGGTPAAIVGWGASDNQGTPTEQLLEGDIEILGTDGCYALLDGLFDHADQICGGGLVNDTCFGDSGGPLLIDDGGPLLVAVTSYGDATCEVADASGYTRVSTQRDWIEDLTGLAPRPGNPRFDDLTAAERHFDAIVAIVDEGIATGFPDGTYGPDRRVMRAQMASFLARALELSASGAVPFDDVAADSVHADAIAAVAEAGISMGYPDGTFRPQAQVTRAQMASFLARALELSASGAVPFDDVAADSVHADAIAAVAEAGISTGFTDGTFGPWLSVTRAQMASFLARGLDLLVLTPSV